MEIEYTDEAELLTFMDSMNKYKFPTDPTRLIPLYEKLALETNDVKFTTAITGKWYRPGYWLIKISLNLWRRLAKRTTIQQYIERSRVIVND